MSSTQANGSGAMFDRIASRYDLLNRVLSLGLDQGWRRALVEAVTGDGARRILDVATGTGDVAIELAKHRSDISVVGLDPSLAMLDEAPPKIDAAGLPSRIEMVEGDGCALPFADDDFDGACIAFGIRNVPDRPACLREMMRVTRPGGVVAVLELAEPSEGWLAPFARLHVRHVVPRIGAWISGDAEYRYLQSSIAAFPSPDDFAAIMRDAGLVSVGFERMSFGAAHLYVGTVPTPIQA